MSPFSLDWTTSAIEHSEERNPMPHYANKASILHYCVCNENLCSEEQFQQFTFSVAIEVLDKTEVIVMTINEGTRTCLYNIPIVEIPIHMHYLMSI